MTYRKAAILSCVLMSIGLTAFVGYSAYAHDAPAPACEPTSEQKRDKHRAYLLAEAQRVEKEMIFMKHHGTGTCYVYFWEERGETVTVQHNPDATFSTMRGGPAFTAVDCKQVEGWLANP